VLVLKRRRGESIIINDNIEITFLETDHRQARLGITAPREVPVHRKEVYLAIQRENLAAANSSDVGLDLPRDLLGQARSRRDARAGEQSRSCSSTHVRVHDRSTLRSAETVIKDA